MAALGVAALGLSCLTAAVGGPPATAADHPLIDDSPLTWGPCQSMTLVQAGAECSLLSVPLDWDKPAGEKIRIALSRVKATHDRQGVILVDPGGPGAPGLELPAYLPAAVPRDVGHTYDWVGFDPRGVGASQPALSCEVDYLNGPRPAYRPADPHTEAPNEKAWIARTERYTKDCAQHNATLLDHVRTVDTVRDMDAIRAALGESRLNYYGFSYGTFLGQAYATKYPEHVARMVLDGNVPPTYPGYGDGGRAQMTAFQYVIAKFFDWIAQHDSTYHLGSSATAVTAAYTKVENDLTAKPVDSIGSAEWDDVFLVAGYAESRWTSIAGAFSDWVAGRTAAIESQYRETDHPGDDNAFAAFNATYCTDGPFPTDYGKVRADGFSIATEAPLAAWGGFWFSAPCTWWPVAAGAPFRIDGQKLALLATPVLLINATKDGATPFEGALAVRRAFPSSALVAEVDATTHAGSLQGNPCIDDHIADYLATGQLPPRLPGDRADAECARMPWPEPSALDRGVQSSATSLSLPTGGRRS
jgi:pimeloyl-ACP methyl ester carboxylesterase